MPFTQKLLLDIPAFPLALIVIGGSVLLAIITMLILHFLCSYFRLKRNKRTSPIIFGVMAFLYSILLGTVLLTSWIGFNNTETDVQKEANCLIDLYRSTDAFLPSLKDNVRTLLEQYAKSVTTDEWKSLARSELSPSTTEIVNKTWQVFSTYVPKTQTEQVFLQESVRNLCKLREYRTTRLSDSKVGVYPLLWLVLIIGEVATVAFILIFLGDDLTTKLIIAVIFAVLVGLIFFTILLFDFPFTGQILVSSAPFTQALLYW